MRYLNLKPYCLSHINTPILYSYAAISEEDQMLQDDGSGNKKITVTNE